MDFDALLPQALPLLYSVTTLHLSDFDQDVEVADQR